MPFAADDDPTGLSPARILAACESNVADRRAAELVGARLVLAWAGTHSSDPRDDPGHRPVGGGDALVFLGGDGTPGVRALSLPELAVARQVHVQSLRSQLASLLDLRHRLPLTWSRVTGLRAELWLAERVATLTRDLTRDQAALVDRAVARAIGSQAPGRVLAITEAKIIEADPVAHAERLEDQRRRKYVGLSRTDAHGLRLVIARVEAGEALYVDAMIRRIADILASRPDLRPGVPDDAPRDELRSLAFGWLARPADLLALLLESIPADVTDEPDEPGEPGEPDEPRVSRAMALSEKTLSTLRSVDLAKLRPRGVVYVHLHEESLADTVTGRSVGVARAEGIGPLLADQLGALLGHAQITLKPVIDLAAGSSVNGYEHPDSMAERVQLRACGDVFPHASGTSREGDLDHLEAYRAQGPPGQTSDENTGPLTRTPHRAKTHLGHRCVQLRLGTYLWQTRHGLHRLVDAQGTHLLSRQQGESLMSGHQVPGSGARHGFEPTLTAGLWTTRSVRA